MPGWRYLAYRMNGDGTETLLHSELPFSQPRLTRKLSAPHEIEVILDAPVADLVSADGRPMFVRKQTSIYAEDENGNIWNGGVVQDISLDGPKLILSVAGLTSHAKGQFYDGEQIFSGMDAFDLVRHIWAHIQGKPGGNVGMQVDGGLSGVRSGTEAQESTAEVSFTAAPIKLNWWTTDDLGEKIDSLASAVPFEYLEHSEWADGASESPTHRLELGAPTIGRQRNDLRFALGENVFVVPSEALDGDDVVTEVLVLGSGEGKDRIRGYASIVPESSLRSARVVDDKKITSKAAADERARQELASYQPDVFGGGIDTIVIRNHPNAPLGSYDVGDEVPYIGDHDWGDVDIWVKLVELTITPGASDDVVARVVRVDTMLP